MSTAAATPLLLLPASQGRPPEPVLSLAPGPAQLARHEFALLEAWLSSAQTLQLPLHPIECQQQPKGREVQRLLLQAHVQYRGHGDVGPALLVDEGAEQVL